MKKRVFALFVLFVLIFTNVLFVSAENYILKNNSVTVEPVYISDIKIELGALAKDLKTPDRIDKIGSYQWYIYNKDYKNYHQVLIKDNKVAGIFVLNKNFKYSNMKYGDTENIKNLDYVKQYRDKNDNNKLYALFISIEPYIPFEKDSEEYNKINELQIFDITNAFRAENEKKVFKWSDNLEKAASLHSQYMEKSKNFSHTGLNGSSVIDRIEAQGVKWTSCGENIAYGNAVSFEICNQWVNSKGHRENMLGNFDYLGVGYFNTYSTQDFYK